MNAYLLTKQILKLTNANTYIFNLVHGHSENEKVDHFCSVGNFMQNILQFFIPKICLMFNQVKIIKKSSGTGQELGIIFIVKTGF